MNVPVVVLGSDLEDDAASLGWETRAHCEKVSEIDALNEFRVIVSPGIADPVEYPRQQNQWRK